MSKINTDYGAQALDLNQLIDLHGGTGIVSGCTPSVGTNAMEVDVASGTARINGTNYSITASTVLLDSANSDYPRKDLVVVDNTGTVTKITGTAEEAKPAGSTRRNTRRPRPDDVSGSDVAVVAEVWVGAGTSDIVSGDISDRRIFTHSDGFKDTNGDGVAELDDSHADFGGGDARNVGALDADELSSTTFFASDESDLRSKLGSGRKVVLTSDVTFSTQINEFGAGDTLVIPENVTLKLANGSDILNVMKVTADNVTIRVDGTFHLNGNNQTSGGNGIRFDGATGGVVEGSGLITDSREIGVQIVGGSRNVVVRDVHIDRAGRLQSGTATGDAVYFVNAENSHVRGATLSNSWRGGVVFESDSTNGDADRCSAEGCTITGNAMGVWFEASDDAQNRAVNNSLEDNGYQNGFTNPDNVGDIVVQSGGATVANNTCQFTQRKSIILKGDDATIRGNQIRDWNQVGQTGSIPAIHCFVTGTIHGGSLSDNEIDCTNVTNGSGIGATGSDGLVNYTITGNVIRAPPDKGFVFNSNNASTSGTILRDNKVLQVSGTGVFLIGGSDIEMYGNKITLNGGAYYDLRQDIRHRDNTPAPSIDVTGIASPEEGDGHYYDNGTTTGAAGMYYHDGTNWVAS